MTPTPATFTDLLESEPTYSAQEAAALLGRSFSWLDQRVRGERFTHVDRTPIRPLRTAGCYRRFTTEILRDIALCSFRDGRLSMDQLKVILTRLVTEADRGTGECEINESPGSASLGNPQTRFRPQSVRSTAYLRFR
jgi:hypothetical protein